MSIFQELYQLTRSTTMVLIVSADDDKELLTINVLPKVKDAKAAGALAEPLSLTATVAEMDEGFIAALGGYRSARGTLAEQAAATEAKLREATAKAKTEAKTAAKPAAPKPQPKAAQSDDGDERDDGDEGRPQVLAPAVQAPATAPAPAGDLQPSLFGED